MPHLLITIIDDLDRLPELLRVWHDIHVPGVTVMESFGGYRTHRWLSQVGLDFLDRLFDTKELSRRTLLVVIEDENLLEQAVAEAERVMDGFDRPNSGILFTLPISSVKGLQKRIPPTSELALPPAIRPGWRIQRDTAVSEVLKVMDLEATIVKEDTPLNEVAIAMMEHPSSHIVNVVNADGRLTGLINLNDLANDIFFHIMPEEFLSEVVSLEDVLKYADKARIRNAQDAMQSPVWVKMTDMVKDAFNRMHDNRVSGLPVVDDQYHVIGYINLLELLAVCLDIHPTNPEGGQ
jgi:CBS domain-containing protein